MPLENTIQSRIVRKLRQRLPGCVISKGDASSTQGIPDLIVLYGQRWAALEVKRSASASHRPNQEYYVDMLNDWSFAAFIYPENEEEVLDALQRSLKA